MLMIMTIAVELPFGNKQPLYYDALLSASGPYKNYKVNSWRTTYTIEQLRMHPMTCWAIPPISALVKLIAPRSGHFRG